MKIVGSRSLRKIKLLDDTQDSRIIKEIKLQHRHSIKLLSYVQDQITLFDEYFIVHPSCQHVVHKVSIDKTESKCFMAQFREK